MLGILRLAAAQPAPTPADLRGWDYLVDKLVADGVSRERVAHTFGDPRMPPFTGLGFSTSPRESTALYRGFLKPRTIGLVRQCRARYAEALAAAEAAHGVPASVVTAILYVESGCGRQAGSTRVLPRLARLAMANEPANLAANLVRLEADGASAAAVRARATYLEDTFYPEVRGAFEVADRMGTEPLELRGSDGGAFGYPQFLPTSYLRFGEDGDGDGRVSLYDMADAAASCARYLRAHGWTPGCSAAERRQAIWAYNHSQPYVGTILALAASLDGRAPAAPARARVRARPRTRRAPVKARTVPRRRAVAQAG